MTNEDPVVLAEYRRRVAEQRARAPHEQGREVWAVYMSGWTMAGHPVSNKVKADGMPQSLLALTQLYPDTCASVWRAAVGHGLIWVDGAVANVAMSLELGRRYILRVPRSGRREYLVVETEEDIEDRPDEQVLFLRRALTALAMHEVDESLYVDGLLVFDPHRGG